MSETSQALPPGPPLNSWLQTAIMLPFSPRLLAACRRRYGSTFTLRANGVDTLVYVTDPADIKTVFAGDPAVYHAGEANVILRGLLGDSSVLLIDEDTHRDRRRLMMAPFRRDAVNRQPISPHGPWGPISPLRPGWPRSPSRSFSERSSAPPTPRDWRRCGR